MLEARQISKHYGLVRALIEVDFAVARGEVVALAGENGSGKSTLAKILAGAVPADGGELTVDGAPCAFAKPADALGVGIALVTQEPTACPAMSVAENLLLTQAAAVRSRPSGVGATTTSPGRSSRRSRSTSTLRRRSRR